VACSRVKFTSVSYDKLLWYVEVRLFFSGEMLGENRSVSGAMSQHCLSVTTHEEKDSKTCTF
jgi:hypothetical protein